jgi:L-rhamnose-H+ transport protein
MSTMVLGGLGLTLVAGLLSGNCMLPMKFAKRWQWENVWLVFSMVSLVILPWTLALTLAGHLGEIYGALEPRQLALPFLLGA